MYRVYNALFIPCPMSRENYGKIKEIKTIGRGYRRFENFRIAILFFCGGLDLYPQIS